MNKKRIALLISIVALSLLILSGGTMAAVGFSVSGGGTIFPNVVVLGVPVGGLTLEEATERLEEPVLTAHATRTVTVHFPGDTVLEVTASEAGLTLTGHHAALAAYRYGRHGNTFANAWSYLRSQFTTVNLDPFTLYAPNAEQLQSVVASAASEIELRSHSDYELLDDAIVVVTGRKMVQFDEAQLIDIITDAFLSGTFDPIDYEEAATALPVPIDIAAIYESLSTEPEDATFDAETESVTDHVVGVTFDLDLAEQLLDRAAMGDEVTIPLIFTDPAITSEYLESVLFRDVLASSTTNLTRDENRNTNIELSAGKINGMILNPGEQFDFNTVVGQRTSARGFRPGGAFSGTEVISAIGGGICQVSSTIYHALLHTELQVDARRNHTLVVTYLPLGMDAAVAWNGLDFSFTNNTDFPLRIVSYRSGLTMNVRLEGTNRSEYSRIVPESVLVNHVSFPTTYVDDSSLPIGSTMVTTPGRRGHVVDVYQRFYCADGNLIRRTRVSRDTYRAVPQVVTRGTAPAEETPPPAAPPAADPPAPAPPVTPPDPSPDPPTESTPNPTDELPAV